jgi:predicted glycosyltransferase
MRILIDIGHPGHVHLFKNFAFKMIEKGHSILFTCTEKEYESYLLKHYGFNYVVLGKRFKSIPGKIYGLLKFDLKLLSVARIFKPTIFLSHGSMYAAQVSTILNKPHIALEDTGNFEQIALYLPFTDVVLTPESLDRKYGKKQISYNAFHELFYLHPRNYIFNGNIFNLLGIPDGTKYSLLRFVAWNATHDKGIKGLTLNEKLKLVEELEKHSRVFISSEKSLPPSLKRFEIIIPPERMHDIIAGASIFIGEGATMASEAGLLGTPSIYTNPLYACNNQEQSKFGTVIITCEIDKILFNSTTILNENYKDIWPERSSRIIKDKINPTELLVWFMENYPSSYNTLKSSPDFQYNFK